MVKAQSEENADLISKNLHTPKDGSVQKKKNQKFKQTPTGKVTLINGSKAHNSSMKQQDMEKQKSTSPQKSPGKNKEQKKNDPSNKKSPKNEPQKKDASESEEDDSKSDEDINEGIVLEEQIFLQESDSSEDDEDSDEDESEEDSVPNIFGTSLADDTEEDDEDYEEDETETTEGLKDILIKKGVKMFKGVKQNDKGTELNKNSDKTDINSSATDEDEDEDDDDSMEDEEEEGDDDVDESEEETDEDDDDEDSEDEVEGNESTLGLKALLGNSLAEDDDDEDFVEPGEDEDDDTDEDDDDDEEDEEEEKNNSMLENSQEGDADDSLEDVKNNKRTVFVGNLPTEVTKKQLKKQFKKYGHIETIRLRGIVAKTINMPKRVAAITKKVHPKLKSVHAYIKYDSEESAKAALDMNGKIFEGNYLRVDTVYESDAKYDTKKSVFLGNLQLKIDENTVRKHFEDCGEIESVRIVRDNKTGLGKGFGYVNFKTEDAVALALEMNGTKISNREIRVKPCGEHEKKKDKHGKRSLSREKNGASPKKLKNNAEVAVSTQNKDNATRRISKKQEKRASPQQTNMYQGQKADGKKKKGVSKFEKKKKVLAEKLMAKPKKPTN